jgi:hypothetical protein
MANSQSWPDVDEEGLFRLSYPEWESQTLTLDILRASYAAALNRIRSTELKLDACVLELRALMAAAVVRGDLEEVNLLTNMITDLLENRDSVAHQRTR